MNQMEKMFEEDDWEDEFEYENIKRQYTGWTIIKLENFTVASLNKCLDWCQSNVSGIFKKIGWNSGCSYTVGIAFQDFSDAAIFKLRWK